MPSKLTQSQFAQGVALHQAGKGVEALVLFQAVLQAEPAHIDALTLSGAIAAGNRNFEQAAAFFRSAVQADPLSAQAHCNLGSCLGDLNRSEEALDSYETAIGLDPGLALAHYGKGNLLRKLGQHRAAIASYDHALKVRPDYAEALYNRGNSLRDLKENAAAVLSYDAALHVRPGFMQAWANRGNALIDLHQYEAAMQSFDTALAMAPDFAKLHLNRGNALSGLKRLDEALASFEKAIALRPGYAQAYSNRGNALMALKRVEQALESFNTAIALKPDYAQAYANRATAFIALKQLEPALASLDSAISIKPDLDFLAGERLHLKARMCDWDGHDAELERMIVSIRANETACFPFALLSLSSSAQLQLKVAQQYVREKAPQATSLGVPARPVLAGKIRLGYFSMDFREHPVASLAAEIFEIHDRQRFEVYAFSFGVDTGDPMRRRLERAFDQFFDVRDKSDVEIAWLARSTGIDIAIDLAGFTSDSRSGIFAARAAPVQVNYLGYAGTLGAAYVDYMIADPELVPEATQQFYAEKIAYLPSFQPNDSSRVIAEKRFSRAELGLPSEGFVYCCFNNAYKVNPAVYRSWMRILASVPGSVLWLSEDNPVASFNLRKEARACGIQEDRLVFARRMPLLAEHLARYRAADLFLDTLPYNAHTTASDALWAGLPVLTCTGESFASRVAASLLLAVGLPELVTRDPQNYEALAIALAIDPARLASLRERLQRNRATSLLFDSTRYTGYLEQAYCAMRERCAAGLEAEHIYICP